MLRHPRNSWLRKVKKFPVVDRVNDYYAVAADNGRTGWITAADVKPEFGDTYMWSVWPDDLTARYASKVAAANMEHTASQDSGLTTTMFKQLTDYAVNFRDLYKDNKYLFVSGFTVHVGIPPSVDLVFTFR